MNGLHLRDKFKLVRASLLAGKGRAVGEDTHNGKPGAASTGDRNRAGGDPSVRLNGACVAAHAKRQCVGHPVQPQKTSRHQSLRMAISHQRRKAHCDCDGCADLMRARCLLLGRERNPRQDARVLPIQRPQHAPWNDQDCKARQRKRPPHERQPKQYGKRKRPSRPQFAMHGLQAGHARLGTGAEMGHVIVLVTSRRSFKATA